MIGRSLSAFFFASRSSSISTAAPASSSTCGVEPLVHVLVKRVGHQDRRHAARGQLGATAAPERLTARSATAQTSAIAGVKSITARPCTASSR